jgi:hypothetical protein
VVDAEGYKMKKVKIKGGNDNLKMYQFNKSANHQPSTINRQPYGKAMENKNP